MSTSLIHRAASSRTRTTDRRRTRGPRDMSASGIPRTARITSAAASHSRHRGTSRRRARCRPTSPRPPRGAFAMRSCPRPRAPIWGARRRRSYANGTARSELIPPPRRSTRFGSSTCSSAASPTSSASPCTRRGCRTVGRRRPSSSCRRARMIPGSSSLAIRRSTGVMPSPESPSAMPCSSSPVDLGRTWRHGGGATRTRSRSRIRWPSVRSHCF